jgi:hypothetical protein
MSNTQSIKYRPWRIMIKNRHRIALVYSKYVCRKPKQPLKDQAGFQVTEPPSQNKYVNISILLGRHQNANI